MREWAELLAVVTYNLKQKETQQRKQEVL